MELELINKRTEFSKTYTLGNNQRRLNAFRHPIHYKENGEWKDNDYSIIEDKVNKCSYNAELMKDKIGYFIVSKKDGSKVETFLKDIPYKSPTIKENKAIYSDVATDLDIIIEFGPRRVRVWKKLKSSQSLVQFKFDIKEDKGETDLHVVEKVLGYDDNNNQTVSNVSKGRVTNSLRNGKETEEYEMIDTFTNQVKVRDPVTRKISLFNNIKYPIMIDTDVTVGPLSNADDGNDNITITRTGYPTTPTTLTNTEIENDSTYFQIMNYQKTDTAGNGTPVIRKKYGYVRFPGITIPKNSTINSASFKIYYWSNININITIRGWDANDPGQPTAGGDVINNTIWASNVKTTSLSSTATAKLGDLNVKTIIQELVNNYDYDNESMLLAIDSATQTISPSSWMFVYASDQGTTKDASLEIVYGVAEDKGHAMGKPFIGKYWG